MTTAVDIATATNDVAKKETENRPVTYHSKYNDPSADMVIKSEDGMHFRVHSYNMKCWSTYFRNMPDFGTTLHGDSPKAPIDLAINQVDFANIMQLHDLHSQTLMTWYEIASAFKASQSYGFHSLPLYIAAKAGHHVTVRPLEIFEFASQHDFYALAKLAVAFFNQAHSLSSTETNFWSPSLFAHVPGKYVSALYRAIGSQNMEKKLCTEADWRWVASRFEL